MSELEKDREIEELKQRLNKLEKKNKDGIPTYSFSKITENELKKCIKIQKEFDKSKFNNWFNFDYIISDDEKTFLNNLINRYGDFLDSYKKETLKAHFIIPILNKVDFLLRGYKISGLYEELLIYKTDKFIFKGTTGFVFAKGLEESEKPYFFIQEFKRGKKYDDPEVQLLAELISAVELNDEKTMEGAYIKGAIWNFVILEKLEKHKYQYFISKNFDSTKIDDLKAIYKNLQFIKDEVIQMIKKGK